MHYYILISPFESPKTKWEMLGPFESLQVILGRSSKSNRVLVSTNQERAITEYYKVV